MPNILVVDDDGVVRHIIAEGLAADGHRILTAADGREGLAMVRQECPDLVIIDMFMPEMDGLELIRTVRRSDPGIGIVAISGGSMRLGLDFIDAAQVFGATAVLRKPFEIRQLCETVRRILSSDRRSYPAASNA